MNSDTKDRVFLVDGSGYIFRAYYAVQHLSTKSGFPTNALFGFTKMLRKLLDEAKSRHMVMVFDAGRLTFRNELYSEYKANRDECPEDLRKQMPYFRDISEALGLTIMELPGYEADDVIGTLAKRLGEAGTEAVVVSGDKDLLQLVNDKVCVWDTMKDRWFRAPEVVEKMGVPPEKVVELLGLMGDSSDNIPGLQGVGPKTAVQLLEKYGDVATVLTSAEEIREDKGIRNRKKISEAIESAGDLLRLSRELVEINCESPVLVRLGDKEVAISDLSDTELLAATERGEALQEKLGELVDKFEFTTLLPDLKFISASSAATDEPAGEYKTILKKDFDSWLEEFLQQKEFAFDLETTSLDPLSAEIVGLAFCWDDESAYYVPVGHNQEKESQMSLDQVLEAIAPSLSNFSVLKSGQNLKYDISVLKRYSIPVDSSLFDTMIAAYLLNPDRSSYKLSALSLEFLSLRASEFDEVVGERESFAEVPLEEATRYAAEDAHYAWLLFKKFAPMIEEEGLSSVSQDIDMPLVPVLVGMECEGVLLDKDLLSKMSDEFEIKITKLREDIYGEAGVEFNLNSPKQLADVLFNQLEIPTKGVKKTKTGFSTNSAVLEMLSAQYELPKRLLSYRMLHKLKSTYIDALPAQVSEVTGRLHSKFNQTVTGTGRLSSSDPNLQNIPIQTEEGRRIRTAFIAPAGTKLISADYSQIELRLLAHMSGDETMISAFENNVDIHANTAREILGLSATDEVSKEDRRVGKTINFGIVYGMSGFRLGRELGIPVGMAAEYIESYFAKFASVKEFFATLEEQAERDGFVTTLFGRKRIIASIDSSGRDRGFLRRVAINAPLQGTAADIIKLAMVSLNRRIQTEKLPLKMILQIHDELVLECDESFLEEGQSIVREEMAGVYELCVPLRVDVASGANWDEAH